MKFLVFSKSGDGNGLAWRLMQEGHEVRIWYWDKRYAVQYDGIVDKVEHFEEGLEEGVICVFDMVGQGKLADELKEAGYVVFGAGEFMDNLELDREFSMETFVRHGIEIPETFSFDHVDEAIDWAKGAEGKWVIKPNGNQSCMTTAIVEGAEQLANELAYMKEHNITKKGLIIQEFIEGLEISTELFLGLEISTELFLSKGEPILPVNHTLETKKLLNGDLGPNTGCSSSIVWGGETNDFIYRNTIKKLISGLGDWTGPLDLNVIVSEDGKPYVLEPTCRFGWSAALAMFEILPMGVGEFIEGIAKGTIRKIDWKKGFGGALRIWIPPYPFEAENEEFNQKIYEQTKGIELEFPLEEGFYPQDVVYENDTFKMAGTDGIVMEVTSWKMNIPRLIQDLMAKAKRVKVPGGGYRTDIAEDGVRRYRKFLELARKGK